MTIKKWDNESIGNLFNLPFTDLIIKAQQQHRQHFKANEVQLCALLSVKTGACPEDCAYCPQSGHYKTGLKKEFLLDLAAVKQAAEQAKANGVTRLCLGAAWRAPPQKDFPKILKMIDLVKSYGLESCVTLGTLSDEQAQDLKAVGLDYYNHNLDTSPDYYKKIISTRDYAERIETLTKVANNNINVCCGGIIGMGESREDRIELLYQLANLPEQPKSVPINRLIPAKGTPLEHTPQIDNFEFIRNIAVARVILPHAVIRLSAGRETMSEEMQALCFMAGAHSIFVGEKLLTLDNPSLDQDIQLLKKLGISGQTSMELVEQ